MGMGGVRPARHDPLGVLRELSATARGVRSWVERLPVRRIALVGWSQGGALAVHLLRQQPDRFVSAAVVAGFVADTRPHAGVRARRPPVWYGMGGRDDVISVAMAARSRRWLGEHTTATLVDLPDEDHMLSPTFVGPALDFTAAALERAGGPSGSAGMSAEEGDELRGQDHRAQQAPERACAAGELVERPDEQGADADAVDRGGVTGRQVEPPQHHRGQPDGQRRVRQLPHDPSSVRRAEPPGRGPQPGEAGGWR